MISCTIETPLGPLLAIADQHRLHLLEFLDRIHLEKQTRSFPSTPGQTPPLLQITQELNQYFSGNLRDFQTPLHLCGTPFQLRVWRQLQTIPFGSTRSYSDLASEISAPSSHRAVAKANSSNRLALIIPCHRVIYHNGSPGGYAGGVSKKQWLLLHEHRYSTFREQCKMFFNASQHLIL